MKTVSLICINIQSRWQHFFHQNCTIAVCIKAANWRQVNNCFHSPVSNQSTARFVCQEFYEIQEQDFSTCMPRSSIWPVLKLAAVNWHSGLSRPRLTDRSWTRPGKMELQATTLMSVNIYSVSQKIPAADFGHFSQTVGNFKTILYTPITCLLYTSDAADE